MKVRTTNALMKYLREKHNISIEGTKDKKNLRNITKMPHFPEFISRSEFFHSRMFLMYVVCCISSVSITKNRQRNRTRNHCLFFHFYISAKRTRIA